MLTKDLLRVSRAGGDYDYRPRFAGREHRPLAARALGTYRERVGERREALTAAFDDLERDADAAFKLVRGFAALLDREATFETRSPLPPERTRRAAFAAGEAVGVSGADDRAAALAQAADRLGADVAAVEASLYADRESRQRLVAFDSRWDPDELIQRYNLSLAQTALFDATEMRVRTDDPRGAVAAAKRLGLLYELRRTDDGRELVITGPDALFRHTRRYGTAFARLLRSVATATEWTVTATVDDRGTRREMRLTQADVSVPGVEPVAEPTYDSGVEAEFAARFEALDLDWALTREPEPLATGHRVMIPDFAFDYRPAGANDEGEGDEEGAADAADGADAPARIFFEIMGFWTPEYVEKKLSQLADVEDVALVVAVDESLGVGEEVAARDHRVITYSGSVRVGDVVDVLREYEADLVADAAATLPDELVPEADAVPLAAVAADRGVSVEAVEAKAFPDHERVGRTLVRPAVLDDLRDALRPGMSLSEAEDALDEASIDDASAALSALGYRVEWEGLGGGTVREKPS